jgi:long-chain acyl-CoA synthetase
MSEVQYIYEGDSPFVRPGRRWRKWHSKEIPISINYPDIPIFELIRGTSEKFPDNVAVYYLPEDKKYTYREIVQLSTKLSNALIASGVRKGDAVGVMMWNCPEFIVSLLGILQTGAACTPINPLFGRREVEYIIERSGIMHRIIVDSASFPLVKNLGLDVILAGRKEKAGARLFQDFIKAFDAAPPSVNINPKEDLALLVFTGGTTGHPKGVMLSHYNITSGIVMSSVHPEWAPRRGKETVLAMLPMCHIYGFDLVMMSLYAAMMIVMANRFDAAEVLQLMEKFRVRGFAGIPTMYAMLVNHPDFMRRDLSSLEECISGAAPLPSELARKWKEKTGVTPLQLYGLTECTPVTASPEWVPPKPQSVGIPVIDLDLKIVNESGEELPSGAIGEILIRCPWVMKGYWRMKDETGRVLKNGWFHTGDLAYMDGDGYVYITGRMSDLIKYKGYKVFPDEIEEAMYEHAAVRECGVVGVPDEIAGETIIAFVVLKDEYRGKVSEDEMVSWAKEKLGYKHPRKVVFINSIPKTHIGKVHRMKLREMSKKSSE